MRKFGSYISLGLVALILVLSACFVVGPWRLAMQMSALNDVGTFANYVQVGPTAQVRPILAATGFEQRNAGNTAWQACLPENVLNLVPYSNNIAVGGNFLFNKDTSGGGGALNYSITPATDTVLGDGGHNLVIASGYGVAADDPNGFPGGNGGIMSVTGGNGGNGTAANASGNGGTITIFGGFAGTDGGGGRGGAGEIQIDTGQGDTLANQRICVGCNFASGNAREIWLGSTASSTDVYVRSSRLLIGLSNTMGIFSGAATPEGAITASPGSIYLRTGGGAGTSFYVKETGVGNTGWVAK